MATVNENNPPKFLRTGSNRWSRVRQAYESGELDRQNVIFRPTHNRPRRNALADISTISTKANTSCQKHQFHQLVERVRELQKEIVPDLLLYQMPNNYSSFSTVTPNSNASRGSLSIYPHRQSISISSGSSNSSIPSQRLSLSSRIVERAHQIPERFWIDWQQKQMQEQIEELEYIKNNINFGSNSSLLSNETDDNGTDSPTTDPRTSYDEIRRKSILFLHEAQRLANQRRTSLAQSTTVNNTKAISHVADNDDHDSFNFDQRSEETTDTANINDVEETPSEPIIPIPSEPFIDHSHSTISLPFTYTKTREKITFPNNYRHISNEPILEEVNDEIVPIASPTESIEDVAQINTELNLTLLKQIKPLLYSRATVNRSIEFRKFRPKNITIHIPISKRKEIDESRMSSPTLSFKSARSRLSSIDCGEDVDDDIQSIPVIPPSLSVSPHSRSLSSHSIPTITECCDHNNKHTSLKQEPFHKCSCFKQNFSMTDVYDSEQNYRSSSYSITPSEEKENDNLPFSRTLFTCRHRQQGRKKKGNTSNLSLVSTPSSQNNPTLLKDAFYQAIENSNKQTLDIGHNSSIISSKRTEKWKQNASGFQADVLTTDNNDGDKHIIHSSSSSVAAAADCFIRHPHRKQTRLKRKTTSEKREEKKKKKKKKKERNKKSPSSTTGAEAAEASLFQFYAVDTPAIDTSTVLYPFEQARCSDKSAAKEKNSFPKQTTVEHLHGQKQQSKLKLIMADNLDYIPSNPIPKKKDHVRVFVRRRRRTTKHRKRTFLHSSSSGNSHETIPSSSNNIEELISMVEQQINNKKHKSRNNKNIIVVNYKPVFVNSRQQKSSSTSTIPKPKIIPTDDELSSATHYSRPRSLTTTSSDGSPRRSTTTRSHNQQSVSLDVPDVEDPLMFIELMYQQLFTEDGRLRSGTEPTALTNCVKQIVTNSRRNSISSSIANGSTSSLHSKPKLPSYPHLIGSSPRLVSNEQYETFSEEEEEPNTLVQSNNQRHSINTSERNSKRLPADNVENHSQIHAFLNSCQQKRTTVTSNGFRFSLDDTDNEDLDTFSDLNSIRFNNKTMRTSPSVDEDLTQTDSRLLSSSGYQSLDRSSKSVKQQKPILSKSHSENDLFHSFNKNDPQIKCIHYCSNCIPSPHITVIPPVIPPSSTLIQRIQQPVGEILMKYLNFILISKNVLLLPLIIFLLRQRSIKTTQY